VNAPLLPNEKERLAALSRYGILDTPDEAAFDSLTALASRLFNVPTAIVSLVDENRQWFKSRHGTSLRETSREISFCAHALLGDGVMVVPDAAIDPRFERNPLVTGTLGIRFYAGAPIKVAGAHNLGTLCLMDTVPRDFSAEKQQVLADLAALAADEMELRIATRENRRLTTSISHLGSGVVVTDPCMPDNPVIFVNPGFSAITGYQPEEVLGRNCRFLQGPDSDAVVVKDIHNALANQRPVDRTLLNYRKNGSSFWNELTIRPVFDQDGSLMNFVGLITDVSERRKIEALRDGLMHMIVHDLRTPVGVILAFLDIIKDQAATKLDLDDIHFVHFIEIVRRNAETLNDMITTLLDVNRLEAGEMPLHLENCNLCELVESATAATRALVGERRLSLDLPSTPVTVPCDPAIILRVINNLVSNALKFTPQGGKVRVAVDREQTLARVSVGDDGPGIPKEFYGRIFEKFGQLEGDRQIHSTGLGLTFCKLAVETHRGTISVESEPNKGSIFSFTLPLDRRTPDALLATMLE